MISMQRERERGSFGQVPLAVSTGFPRSRLSRVRDAVHAQAPDTELLDSVGPSFVTATHVTCVRLCGMRVASRCQQMPAAISCLTKAFLSSFLLWAKDRRHPEFKDERKKGQNLGSQKKREERRRKAEIECLTNNLTTGLR